MQGTDPRFVEGTLQIHCTTQVSIKPLFMDSVDIDSHKYNLQRTGMNRKAITFCCLKVEKGLVLIET